MFNIYRTRIAAESLPPAKAAADALAFSANDHLWMGHGLAGELKTAGGEEIEIEAVRQGPVELGRAVATNAGTLPFRRLYHLIVMGQDLHIQPPHVRAALADALAQASRDGVETLAISPLAPEDQSASLRDATRQAAAALVERLAEKTALKRVVLVGVRAETMAVYREAFLEILRAHPGE